MCSVLVWLSQNQHLFKVIIVFLDINECLLGTSGCIDNCINTVGAYYCTCETGYELANDNHSCIGQLRSILDIFYDNASRY